LTSSFCGTGSNLGTEKATVVVVVGVESNVGVVNVDGDDPSWKLKSFVTVLRGDRGPLND
jgi:hypothetical protein